MASFQQGFIPLTTSTSEYVVTFPVPFSTAPSMVLTQVINTEGGDTTHMWIEGVVHSRSSADLLNTQRCQLQINTGSQQ